MRTSCYLATGDKRANGGVDSILVVQTASPPRSLHFNPPQISSGDIPWPLSRASPTPRTWPCVSVRVHVHVCLPRVLGSVTAGPLCSTSCGKEASVKLRRQQCDNHGNRLDANHFTWSQSSYYLRRFWQGRKSPPCSITTCCSVPFTETLAVCTHL